MWKSVCQLSRHFFLATLLSWAFLRIAKSVQNPGDLWPLDRPDGMPTIQSLEVMCGKDHMDVHLTFSHGFEGIVSSKGQHGDPRCVYVPPSTGQTFFSFRIGYSRCGTKADLHGQFYENTVVVQYDKDLIEVWDEAKRLRCEWFNDYEKTASKPPMVIADLDVIQLDFRGDNVDCWMEIQHGKGPWAPPVSGIVPLGSTLTLVVAINDYRGEFDMRVKSCMASDGSGHVIQLSDEFGCVLRPKMISRFLKARGADERASVITYAFFHAFKFPDALSVHIKCKVEICRHGCLDHCQTQANKPPELQGDTHPELFAGLGNPLLERKDDKVQSNEIKDERSPDPVDQSIEEQDVLYDDIIHENQQAISSGEELPAIKMSLNANMNNPNLKKPWTKPSATRKHDVKDKKKDSNSMEGDIPNMDEITEIHKDILRLGEKFPHGPRNLNDPPVAAPRSLNSEVQSPLANTEEKLAKLNESKIQENEIKDSEKEKTSQESATEKEKTTSSNTDTTKPKRRGRSMVVSDRKARSADVGVSGIYEVISEQDLAFSPDTRAEAVAVFQGRIMEEVVYGICMPMPGFSLLFVVVAMSAVISALVAGTLLYRYQLQKEKIMEEQAQNGSIPLSLFSNWINFKLCKPCGPQSRTNMDQNGILDTSLSMNSLCLNGKNSHNKQ